jgi:AcrR family transcriptional regulator
MSELAKGPQGVRRGRGARERILGAAERLFGEQGINNTGMDQLCTAAHVSKRTAYQHFGTKDDLVAAYLRQVDAETMRAAFERPGLSPRERLLAVFERPASSSGDHGRDDAVPGGGVSDGGSSDAALRAGADAPPSVEGCPFIGAAVEIADPQHPARVLAREHKAAVAARLTETAREAGAADPELLGEQLALLLDGASARTRTLGTDAIPTAVGIAESLIAHAIPEAAPAAA